MKFPLVPSALIMMVAIVVVPAAPSSAFVPSVNSADFRAKVCRFRTTTAPALEAAAATGESTESMSMSSSLTLPKIELATAEHPLIQAAHKFAYTQSGFYSPYDESAFSEDFVFRGPYIGPLNKEDYLSTMDTFGIYKALPDISPNCFGYSIDPKNPNRVWFMVRNTGTFTGKPGLGFGGNNYFPPNGASLEGSPETFSIIFDENQKVKYLSVGYVADRFEGNTNGKGAAVGIFNAIGLPFPSPGPGLQLAQFIGTEVLNMGAKSYSTKNIPSWWTSDERASEGYL